MSDNRYSYERINVVKIIIQNSRGEVLLITEPSTNDWMPNHLGLPGGKPLEKESLLDAYQRKMVTDLGAFVSPEGIFRIQELLIEGRTVMMFILVAKIDISVFEGEALNPKWVTKDQVESMDVTEFTEYYNKELLVDFFNRPSEVIPVDLVRTLKYFEMNNEVDYKRWLKSGKKS